MTSFSITLFICTDWRRLDKLTIIWWKLIIRLFSFSPGHLFQLRIRNGEKEIGVVLFSSVSSDLSPDICLFILQMDGRGSIKELFPTGKQLEPLVVPLGDGKVAVGQDDLTVVLNEEGVCTQKCALNWTDIPIDMGTNIFLL